MNKIRNILKKLLNIITQEKPQPSKTYQPNEHIEREYLLEQDYNEWLEHHNYDAEYYEWLHNQEEFDYEPDYEWINENK
jgi:hypothetical protein